MKVAIILLLVAVVCCSAAKLHQKPLSKANVKAVKKYARAMVNSKKMYQRSMNEVTGETTLTKKKTHKSGKTEKKQYEGYNPNCVGARCQCEDNALLGELLGKVGNIVATCRITALYDKLYWDKVNQSLFSDEKREWSNMNYPYDFYGEACAFMEELGLMMEYFSYSSESGGNYGDYEAPDEVWDAYDSINTCCDIKEYIANLNCLGTYMSLLEMKIAEAFHTYNINYLRNENFNFLESMMRYQCDSTFKNEVCLVMGLRGEADLASCYYRVSPLDPSIDMQPISPQDMADLIKASMEENEENSDNGNTNAEGGEDEGIDNGNTNAEGGEDEGIDNGNTNAEGGNEEGTANENTNADGGEEEGTASENTNSEGGEEEGTASDNTNAEGGEEEGTASENTNAEGGEEEGSASENTNAEGGEEEGSANGDNGEGDDGQDGDGQGSNGQENENDNAGTKRANKSPKWKELAGLLDRVLKQRELMRKS